MFECDIYKPCVINTFHSSLVFAAVSLNLALRHGFNFPGNLDNFTTSPDHGSISYPELAFPTGLGKLTVWIFMMIIISHIKNA